MRRIKFGILFVLLLLANTISCKKEDTPQKKETKLIEVSGNLIFGSVEVNKAETKVFTIENAGTGNIQINGISCPDGFSVNWQGGVIKTGESKQVKVTFSPTEAKSYSGEINIKSDAGSSPNSIQVSGNGQIDKAILSISPTSLDFGGVFLDDRKTAVFTIKNTGKASLIINDITVPDSTFTLSYKKEVTIGGFQQITVKFSPTFPKLYSGKITVKTNAGDAEIAVSGTGMAKPKAILSISPTSLNFGDVMIGDNNSKEFTITNKGNAALTINSITPYSPAYTLDYDKTIPAGGSQKITVKFAPTATQSYSGKITIKTNTDNAEVAVSGNGKAKPKAILSVSPTTLDFGDVILEDNNSKIFTISNTGNAALTITNITSPGSVYTLNYDKTVPAGGSQKIAVKFSPKSVQTYSGSIRIKTNGGDDEVFLTGRGTAKPKAILSVSPTFLDFGDITIGEYGTEILTVSNTGNSILTISSIITPSSAFAISYKKDVAAGSSQQVRVKFSPESVQTYYSSIKIKTNGGDEEISVSGKGIAKPKAIMTVSPASLDFGEVAVGNKKAETITISNTGNAPLAINSITSPNSVYTLSNNSKNISAGSSQNITINFTPASVSSYTGKITIATNAGSEQILVSGKGISGARPNLEIEQGYSSLNFGTVNIGYFSYKTFHFYNTGNAPLTINSIRLSNSAFTTPKFTTPTVIAANSSQLIEVRFTPYEAMSYNGTMEINSDGGNRSISMSGQAEVLKKPKPVLLTEYSILNFGTLNINTDSYKSVTFRLFNTGKAPLTVSSVRSNNPVFAVNNFPTPTVIQPNGYHYIEVRFVPQGAGNYTGTLTVNSDGGNASIPVSGQAVGGVPKMSISSTSLDFGKVPYFNKAYKIFRITNTGTAPLKINGCNISSPAVGYFFCLVNNKSWGGYTTIPVGGYLNVTVEFMAPFSYENSLILAGQIHIMSNAGNVDVQLWGVGVASICNATATPAIGNYPSSCDYNNGIRDGNEYRPQTGIIEAAIAKIDCANHSITFQFKRCDRRGFLHEGKAYVVSSYGVSESGWSPISFKQGEAYETITIKDNNMTGTKTYYIETWQDPAKYPEVGGGWAVSNKITVSY